MTETWTIVHRSLTLPGLPPTYWTGEQDWNRGADVFTERTDRAARFTSDAAETAFRGEYRPARSCCTPELIA